MRKSVLLYAAGAMAIGLVNGSEPTVAGIDYANPDKYLELHPTLGAKERIAELAAELEDESDLVTIRNILEWKDEHLQYDGDRAYVWRNFDTVLEERCYGGCADEGLFCGALLKAAGIPTLWVKTMDVDWIWAFKKGRSFSTWSGHVFLEVFVDGRWMLLDPGGKRLYRDYAPETRILPGNRFAYHKGDDPKAMILSLQWEEWKEQTTEYFTHLDASLLPVDATGAVLLDRNLAYVIGNSPYYQQLTEMAHEKGYKVPISFNTDYDHYLPAATGHVLLMETHGDTPIVARDVLEKHFPGAWEGLGKADGTVEVEGTTVVFFDFDDPGMKWEP